MDEAAPAAAAGASEPAVKKSRLLRRVPTSLLVTLLGIALTAWLLPAFTRQWDDRQKAQELKVAITDDVATATARAFFGTKTSDRNASFAPLLAALSPPTGAAAAGVAREWELSSFKIAAKLKAYFRSPALDRRWQTYSTGVYDFFLALASPSALRPDALGRVVFEFGLGRKKAEQFRSAGRAILREQHKFDRTLRRVNAQIRRARANGDTFIERQTLRGRSVLSQQNARDIATNWTILAKLVQDAVLQAEARVSRAILAGHPIGYSTTTHDLLHELFG